MNFIDEILKRLKGNEGFTEERIKSEVINGKFDKTESTPLIRACSYGNLELVKYLYEKLGAIPEIVNKNDETCLIVAVRNKQAEVVKYICQHVIMPNSKLEIDYESNRNGLNALARAVLQGDFNIADILLNIGRAYKDYHNRKEGLSIAQLAKKHNLTESINYMTRAGAGGPAPLQ